LKPLDDACDRSSSPRLPRCSDSCRLCSNDRFRPSSSYPWPFPFRSASWAPPCSFSLFSPVWSWSAMTCGKCFCFCGEELAPRRKQCVRELAPYPIEPSSGWELDSALPSQRSYTKTFLHQEAAPKNESVFSWAAESRSPGGRFSTISLLFFENLGSIRPSNSVYLNKIGIFERKSAQYSLKLGPRLCLDCMNPIHAERPTPSVAWKKGVFKKVEALRMDNGCWAVRASVNRLGRPNEGWNGRVRVIE